MLPNRFTRYVLRELLGPTLLGLTLYLFVLLMNHFFVVAEKSLSKNLGWELTFRLFIVGIPSLLVLSIPMAVLLGSLVAIGRLSADHEWVALQSAGHGASRLLKPLVIHGLLASLASFMIYAQVVPRSSYALRNLRGELLFASNLAADLKPRVFYSGLPNVVLFVDEIKAGSQGRLEGVLLVQSDPRKQTTELFLARSGDLYPAPDRSGALFLDLNDGVAHLYGASSADVYRQAEGFDEFRRRLDPAAYLKAFLAPPEKVVQDLSPREIVRDIRETEAAIVEKTPEPSPVTGEPPVSAEVLALEHRRTRAKIELHQRMALPLASFVFAILALPLGVSRVRSGKGAGFAMSLLVIVVYWGTFTFTRDQAIRGRLSPDFGPWIANGVILLWALLALWRMKRMPRDGRGPLAWVIAAGFRLARRIRDRSSSRTATGEPGAELETFSGTSTRFIARLDQYVGAQYLRILSLSMLSAYLIYMLVETKRMMDALLRTQQPPSLLFSYFKYFIPGTLHLVLPISCLIAAVVTFTVLSRTGELTAIKATGISMRRVTFAVILLTALLCAMLFLVQDRIAPTANRKAQEIQDQITGRAPRTYGLPRQGMWAFGPEGQRLYHYVLYDPEREEFQGLRVFTIDRRRPRIVDHRFSERARWRGDHWELEGGWYRAFPEDGEVVFEVNEGVIELPLDPPKNFASREVSLTSADELPDQMSLAELQEQIATLKKSGYDITQLVVAYHSKIARALTPLVMVLLGLPFAFRVGRRGSLYGIGVAILLVLVYWATFAVFHALGQETVLDPRVAAWAPNVMFGLFGVYLMLYVKT